MARFFGLRACRQIDRTPQKNACWVCGQRTKDDAERFLIDRHTQEILDPEVDDWERGNFWPIGPECLRKLGR